jgi:hypothetical protein
MKTFLHYTKERELDEGVLSTIGGVAGSLTRGVSTVAKGADWFRSNIAPAFQQGAKPGSTLMAVGAAASGATSAAEQSREKAFQRSQRFVSAKRRSLGKNHPKVNNFDKQEADILDPNNTTYKDDGAREAALRKHYSDYKWN